MKTRAQMTKAERIAHTVRSVEDAGCSGAKIGSVNLIWPLLIFSFGSTPSGESTPAPRRSEALRRP